MENEQVAFTIILHAGEARSHALEALKAAREHKFAEAEASLVLAKKQLIAAHQIQTDLLQAEARGEKKEVNLLLIHAQDHLMTAILAKDLIEEMVLMFKK